MNTNGLAGASRAGADDLCKTGQKLHHVVFKDDKLNWLWEKAKEAGLPEEEMQSWNWVWKKDFDKIESDATGSPDPGRAARIEKLRREVKCLERQVKTDESKWRMAWQRMAGIEKALRTKLYKRRLREVAQKNGSVLIPYRNKSAIENAEENQDAKMGTRILHACLRVAITYMSQAWMARRRRSLWESAVQQYFLSLRQK